MTNHPTVPHDRPLWSDQDLDEALRHLQTAAAPGTPLPKAARDQLLRAADDLAGKPAAIAGVRGQVRPLRPRWRRPILIAATIAALVAGGLILPTLRWGGPPVNSAVAAEFNAAADAAARVAAAGGDAIPAGAYRYINIDGWVHGATDSDQFGYLEQTRRQIWVPADWHDTWLERDSTTGQRKPVYAPGATATKPVRNVPARTDPEMKGPCADYFINMCTTDGSWQTPTQGWIAGLPTNGADMYNRLYDDSRGHGQSQQSEMLVQATDALRTGLLPASVRATLYRAMAQIGGVEIGDAAVNLNGRVGTGFTVTGPALRDETIIDPTTGEFIGTRTTTLGHDAVTKNPAGAVISYTAVDTQIVKTLGATHP